MILYDPAALGTALLSGLSQPHCAAAVADDSPVPSPHIHPWDIAWDLGQPPYTEGADGAASDDSQAEAALCLILPRPRQVTPAPARHRGAMHIRQMYRQILY